MLEYDIAYDNEAQENPAQADLNYIHFLLTIFLWLLWLLLPQEPPAHPGVSADLENQSADMDGKDMDGKPPTQQAVHFGKLVRKALT